ncbi:recombinase family protein [Silicimonas sp. MF1-12-2]|uniref:recombinase family protein n=1 Tax=Silicimonas sp. MF1-12-2 TaxID=3384793 RepID=UPI0039B5A3D4
MQKIRCAIYTRKSSEDGLEQEFNSLHAQREACAAYIHSQKAEGWVLLEEAYDDGGLSGGTLDRPALQRLLDAVDDGRVDRIVVYKIDRLTRSLADFARIVDRLDAAGASFVSVTQSFNTATSMGRLTLNMLLSFAQFEREVTAERIRDKIAASKKKGLWMGGNVPMGYEPDGRTLRVLEPEAETIRMIYDLYRKLGTVRAVRDEAERLGLRTRRRIAPDGRRSGGGLFDRGHIHHILTNPVYAGRIRHRTRVYDGQHPPIIDPKTWDAVQRELKDKAARRRSGRGGIDRRHAVTSPLAGKLFDETGDRLTPTHTKTSAGKRLRYYVSNRLVQKSGEKQRNGWRLPAPQLEDLVAAKVSDCLRDPKWRADLTQDQDSASMTHAPFEDEATIESARTLLGLIQRIDLAQAQLTISLDADAISHWAGVDRTSIDPKTLIFQTPFQQRRRGVETKLIIDNPSSRRDDTLIRNVALAHAWFAELRAGASFADVAERAGTSKRRVMQLVDLAFLAPDLTGKILDGRQPPSLTSDLLIKEGIPSKWTAQRQLFDSLR